MALSVVSSPQTVNATTNNLPIVVTSPSMSMAQYRLVSEIYIPARQNLPVTTIKTFPSASVAMIDIARICSNYLTYDTPMEITGSKTSTTNAAIFKVVMGEEYSDSPSGSIVAYNGLGGVGSPAFTASFSSSVANSTSSILLVPAVNEYSSQTYDWPESEWSMDPASLPSGQQNPFLTNNPSYQTASFWNLSSALTSSNKRFSYDFETISLVTDQYYNGLSFVEAKVYNSAGSLVYSNNSSFVPGGSTSVPLTHVGIGPANLSASMFPNSVNANSASAYIHNNNWSRITYEFEGISDNYNIAIVQASCSFYDQTIDGSSPTLAPDFIKGRTRFAFINKYGVMDYYNVVNPVRKRSKISRKNYVKPQLPWTNVNTTSGAVFDGLKRGKDDYYTTYVDNFQVTTDYIDQETSDWLTELVESPAVWIQNEAITNLPLNFGDFYVERQTSPNGFAPINIKNAGYTWKTNKFSQKLFQYDLEWEMSNVNIGR